MRPINMTAGNDATFVVRLTRGGEVFPIESATGVKVYLVQYKTKREMEYSITESGVLEFTVTGVDKAASYDLDISGVLDDHAWRTCGRNVIEYTYDTREGDETCVVAGDDFEISMTVQLYVDSEGGGTSGFVTQDELQEVADSIPTQLSELGSDANHRTVTDAEKEQWNNNSVPTKLSQLENDVPYATQSWVQNQGYLTEHQSLSGYATQTWVQSQGYLTQHQSLSGYATETWVQQQGYLTEHQSLSGYATETWVQQQGYLTEHQSLSGYATETWVTSQGYLTQHQDISGKEDTSNKVTSLSASSTNTQYPSAKCVYDALAAKQGMLTFDTTPTDLSTNPVTSGGVYNATVTKQEKMIMVSSSQGQVFNLAAPNFYHLFTNPVNTLEITLPTISSVLYVQDIIFGFTTGESPALTFTSTHNIYYADGYEIEANSRYEVNALFNGIDYTIMATKIATS